MDILEKIELFLDEEVASGGAAMGGDGSGVHTPGTTTPKVAKYEKRSSIMTGGKSRRKKKKRDSELTLEAGDKRDKDKHRYASDEVDHEDSEQSGPANKKRVKSGTQAFGKGIGWHLRQS